MNFYFKIEIEILVKNKQQIENLGGGKKMLRDLTRTFFSSYLSKKSFILIQ
jgi:hypothetical protein